MNDDLMRLVAANEQDRAECVAWWRNTPRADKLRVFQRIIADEADPVMEIMTRFAQLSFLEMVEKYGI